MKSRVNPLLDALRRVNWSSVNFRAVSEEEIKSPEFQDFADSPLAIAYISQVGPDELGAVLVNPDGRIVIDTRTDLLAFSANMVKLVKYNMLRGKYKSAGFTRTNQVKDKLSKINLMKEED